MIKVIELYRLINNKDLLIKILNTDLLVCYDF